MASEYYALIMAGGGGTRLWPLSRKATPKQLLPLIDDRSLFKTAVERLAPVFTPERVYVVTGPQYAEAMQADMPEIPAENFVVEPYGRNTGPAAALGVSVIAQRHPDATVAILTADHHISKEEGFRNVLQAAYDMAQEDQIITLGIEPSYPATGFGYIHQGEKIKDVRGIACYHALGFTEKPDATRAAEFLATGQYSWNSGMFIWTAKHALAEFKRQQPEMHALFEKLRPTIDTPAYTATLAEIWDEMPNAPIDTAVMEGAEHMAVFPVAIGWSDVGSWSSLFEVQELDEAGNSFRINGDANIALDTKTTMVFSERLVATIGVNDLIIIDTEDALLVCHKDETQRVKEIVNYLKEKQANKYL